MNDFDKATNFIQNHDFAIVVFNKNAKELYKRIRQKYSGAINDYSDVIAYRFIFNKYAGYTIYPKNCYDIENGKGCFEGQEYVVLSFDKRRVAKVV